MWRRHPWLQELLLQNLLDPSVDSTMSPLAEGACPTWGHQKRRVQTNERRDAMVLYHIAEVSRPLTAVSQTCDNGNCVMFTPNGGFIWNLKTGSKTNFERRGGIYELDLWVKDADLAGGGTSTGFPRPGNH